MEKTNFCEGKGKVYMTHPTKAIYRFLMSDFVRISNAGSDRMLFDEAEMLASWRQIEAVDYHQEVVLGGGLRFTPYHAGHVLGACMFMIDMAGLRVLYGSLASTGSGSPFSATMSSGDDSDTRV